MRPIFSRGNSVSSFTVNDKKPEDENKKKQRRRRLENHHVRFAEEVTKIPSAEPLSQKELICYFYSTDDLGRFNRDRALTALLYMRQKDNHTGFPWDDNVNSIRGLEEGVRKDHTTQAQRLQHTRNVLHAQEQLKEEGRGLDALALYEVSAKSSASARAEALALGKEDAAAVNRNYSSLMHMVRIKLSALLEK